VGAVLRGDDGAGKASGDGEYISNSGTIQETG